MTEHMSGCAQRHVPGYETAHPDPCPLCGRPGDQRLRVGTDVQEIAPVEDALRAHPDRYLTRLFTEHEIACVGWPDVSPSAAAPGLAGRYAVKEAVIKVLRPIDRGVRWREIEIRREVGGWCSLRLSGSVRGLAKSCGLGNWAISFSHDGGVAVATVMALESCSAMDTDRATTKTGEDHDG